MKEYKVGDTIYIKDTVKEIDHNPETYAKYSTLENNWIDNDTIIDELPPAEPVKPVIPKDVADELEDAKKTGYHFVGYMNKAIDNDYDETNRFVYLADVSTDEMIKVFSDAWYNGYTIEKPKLYNLVLGKDSHGDTNAFVKAGDSSISYLVIDPFTDCEDDLQSDSDYQFTQEEIDKYNKNFWIKNFDLNDYKVEVPTDDD